MDTDLAWAAGFFDGEGSVTIRPIGAGGSKILSIQVGQIDKKPLDELVRILGGRINGPYHHKKNNHAPYYAWSEHGVKARAILERLLPYLRSKTGQAQVGIEFDVYREANKRPGFKITDEERARREAFVTRLKAQRYGYYAE